MDWMRDWPPPRTETFLRADLADLLLGIARAGMGPRNRGVTLRDADYRDGYLAACEAMAAALGIRVDVATPASREPSHKITVRRR